MHGWPALHPLILGLTQGMATQVATLVSSLYDALACIAAGALALAVVTAGHKLLKPPHGAALRHRPQM